MLQIQNSIQKFSIIWLFNCSIFLSIDRLINLLLSLLFFETTDGNAKRVYGLGYVVKFTYKNDTSLSSFLSKCSSFFLFFYFYYYYFFILYSHWLFDSKTV